MPRIRSIKPQFWLDEDLGKLPRDVRLLYIGLWNIADDSGVFEWRAGKIRIQLFPYDLELKNSDIEKWLSLLEGTKDIVQFLNGENGKPYGYIPSFSEHQQITNPSGWRFAKPPDNLINQVDKDEHKFEKPSKIGAKTSYATIIDDKCANIAKTYESEIGQLTPNLADRLKEISDEYPEGWFEDAVKEATENNKRNLRYIEAILKRWKAEGKGAGKKKKGESTGIEVEE